MSILKSVVQKCVGRVSGVINHGFQVCGLTRDFRYLFFRADVEDRALLGSNLSAAIGPNTAGRGGLISALACLGLRDWFNAKNPEWFGLAGQGRWRARAGIEEIGASTL